MGKFLDEIKKDKKKGMILFLVIGVLILVIVLGVFYGESGTTTEEKQQADAGIIVPVDSTAISNQSTSTTSNNMASNSSGNTDDFFAVGEEQNSVPVEEEQEMENLLEEKPVKKQQVYSKPKQSQTYVNPQRASNNALKKSVGSGSYSSNIKSTKSEIESYSKREENYSNSNSENNEESTSTIKGKRTRGKATTTSTSKSSGKMYSAAISNGNKLVKAGSYVSIRVAEDITVDNMVIKRNSVISGIASFSNQRMGININAVKINNVSIPVKWYIIDEDGNDGIPVPESIYNDIATDQTSDMIDQGSSQVETNVPIVGSVKVNLKKKVKEASFIINNGHRVFIKERAN